MSGFKLTFLAIFVLALSACASVLAPKVETSAMALKAGEYQLDPNHGALLFKVQHLGLSDFVGRFEVFDASLDFSPDNPQQASLEAIITIASLDIANDDFAKTLLGPSWLNAGQYPQARFVSQSIEITGDNTGIVHGQLSLNGITKPVDMTVSFNGGAQVLLTGKYTIGFTARASFSRSAFGIDKFASFVGDEIMIEFSGEFQRQR